jgi:hypothetical protein
MAGMGSRRSSAVVVIVLLHLAGFGALFGFLLPVEARLGGERMVLFAAYLLGLRWAFDPVNVATIGAADRRLDSLGRSSVASASWFAAGFAATVAGLAFLFTVVLRTLARTDPRLTPDGSLTWLFLGVLGAVQLVVLAGAVRRRRAGEPPVAGRADGLTGRVRRSVQLLPVGALAGLGAGPAAEIGLLVLAGGQLAFRLPAYLTIVLPLLFAAGMSLTSLFSVRTPPARSTILHIVLAGAVASGALGPILIALFGGLTFPRFSGGTSGLLDYALSRPAALAGYLSARPALLLFLLLLLLAVPALRFARTKRTTTTTGPARPPTDRDAAPAQPSLARPRPTQSRPTQSRSAQPRSAQPAPVHSRPTSPGPVQPSPVPARAEQPWVEQPAVQRVPYQRTVARATVADVVPSRDVPGPVPAVVSPVPAVPAPVAVVSSVPVVPGPVSVVAGPVSVVAGIAIVIGAGNGLGRSVALALADAGYGILAVDIDPDSAAACANEARTHGVAAQAIRADVRDPRYLERIVAVAEQWGRTEVLVTAGAGGWPAHFAGQTAEMRLTGLVADRMRPRGGGAIVNTVPGTSADVPALIRFTGDRAGARDRVRTMCLIIDELEPTRATVTAMDLIRRGSAGTVRDLTAPAAPPAPPRFTRGVASVA